MLTPPDSTVSFFERPIHILGWKKKLDVSFCQEEREEKKTENNRKGPLVKTTRVAHYGWNNTRDE